MELIEFWIRGGKDIIEREAILFYKSTYLPFQFKHFSVEITRIQYALQQTQ
ncbi:MAG: hypothetical protein IPO26_21190 [Saprospiraceae bacterium]|nr:hypothetical protein [Saprospiraceae bacterium]